VVAPLIMQKKVLVLYTPGESANLDAASERDLGVTANYYSLSPLEQSGNTKAELGISIGM